jgi:hypothetical protein
VARKNGRKLWRIWLHHVANTPKIVARKVGRLWSDVREEVWFGSFFQRLIVFFLNLSQDLKLVLLLYFRTLGDGYSLKGSKK